MRLIRQIIKEESLIFDRIFSREGLTILVGLGVVMCLWVSFPQAQPEIPDELVFHSELWPKKLYGDPKLTHRKHATEYEIQCVKCHHHLYEDEKNVWQEGQEVRKCEACHTGVKTGRALKKASPEEQKFSLFRAFHDRCKGCHKELKKEPGSDRAPAPVKCLECHPKKSVK